MLRYIQQLLCQPIALSSINLISDLQLTTSKRARSNRYKLIMNIKSMKNLYGY